MTWNALRTARTAGRPSVGATAGAGGAGSRCSRRHGSPASLLPAQPARERRRRGRRTRAARSPPDHRLSVRRGRQPPRGAGNRTAGSGNGPGGEHLRRDAVRRAERQAGGAGRGRGRPSQRAALDVAAEDAEGGPQPGGGAHRARADDQGPARGRDVAGGGPDALRRHRSGVRVRAARPFRDRGGERGGAVDRGGGLRASRLRLDRGFRSERGASACAPDRAPADRRRSRHPRLRRGPRGLLRRRLAHGVGGAADLRDAPVASGGARGPVGRPGRGGARGARERRRRRG